MPRRFAAALPLALSCAFARAEAATVVRVGQPQAGTFQFVPPQVGTEAGIFKQHGIDVDVADFGGGPHVRQALAAGSIDIAIGSGPELAHEVKGAPQIADAARADVLAVLARSFAEMGALPNEPDMASLVTEKYLPHRP